MSWITPLLQLKTDSRVNREIWKDNNATYSRNAGKGLIAHENVKRNGKWKVLVKIWIGLFVHVVPRDQKTEKHGNCCVCCETKCYVIYIYLLKFSENNNHFAGQDIKTGLWSFHQNDREEKAMKYTMNCCCMHCCKCTDRILMSFRIFWAFYDRGVRYVMYRLFSFPVVFWNKASCNI